MNPTYQADISVATHFMANLLLQASAVDSAAYAYLKDHLLWFYLIGGVVSFLLFVGIVVSVSKAVRTMRERHKR